MTTQLKGKVIQGAQNLNRKLVHPVVTIGNFDGVHLGHQKIIQLAIEKARQRKGTAVVYTFRPHPQIALRPEKKLQLLSTYDEKLDLLAQLGVDLIIEEPFSREFSTVSADQFFKEILLQRLGAEAIVVGYDFGFGKERQGHLSNLEALSKSAGVELSIVQPQQIGSEVVSSSGVRQHLLAGQIPEANKLLGRPFSYRGVVMKGDGRGKKIGTPTANLSLESKLVLPYGVYATLAHMDGTTYPSVTNIGVRPTFSDPTQELPALVETHLLDTTMDLYGSTLEVRFIQRLREERKFPGISELKNQIAQDIALARQILGNHGKLGK